MPQLALFYLFVFNQNIRNNYKNNIDRILHSLYISLYINIQNANGILKQISVKKIANGAIHSKRMDVTTANAKIHVKRSRYKVLHPNVSFFKIQMFQFFCLKCQNKTFDKIELISQYLFWLFWLLLCNFYQKFTWLLSLKS